jgi:hypothetical protein
MAIREQALCVYLKRRNMTVEQFVYVFKPTCIQTRVICHFPDSSDDVLFQRFHYLPTKIMASMKRHLLLFLFCHSIFRIESAVNPRRAQWVCDKLMMHRLRKVTTHLSQFIDSQMSGRWGIGYRIEVDEPTWTTYNVTAFINQLRTIKGKPGWIIVNLSGPANGADVYFAHHPLLWSLNNTKATPGPTGLRLTFKSS